MDIGQGTKEYPYALVFDNDEAARFIGFHLDDYNEELGGIVAVAMLWDHVKDWFEESAIYYKLEHRKILFKSQEDVTMFILKWTHEI